MLNHGDNSKSRKQKDKRKICLFKKTKEQTGDWKLETLRRYSHPAARQTKTGTHSGGCSQATGAHWKGGLLTVEPQRGHSSGQRCYQKKRKRREKYPYFSPPCILQPGLQLGPSTEQA